MPKIPNKFDEAIKAFDAADLIERAQEMFAPKSYQDRNMNLKTAIEVLKYLLHVVSAVCAAAFVYANCYSIVEGWAYANIIAYIPTFIVLVAIELILSMILDAGVTGYFNKNGKWIRSLVMAGLISLVSIALSFFGSYDTVRLAKSPPTLAEPDTTSIQRVVDFFAPDIEQAQKDADGYFDKRQWKGRIASKDAGRYNELLDIKNGLVEERNEAIITAKFYNEEEKARVKAEYEQALLDHESSIKQTGGGLGIICIICQLLLWICYYWLKEFHFNIIKQSVALAGSSPTPLAGANGIDFNHLIKQAAPKQTTPSQNQIPAQKIGFRLNGTLKVPEPQQNDDLSSLNRPGNDLSSTQNGKPSTIIKKEFVLLSDRKRNCDHCGTEYIYRSTKSKYCTDACRKNANKQKKKANP